MQRIRNPNEVATGIFLIVVAIFALYLAWPLSWTTDMGLGPGYLPKALALIQIGLGVLIIIQGFVSEPQEMEAWHLRPLVLILGSVAFFAASIERLGLVVALTGLVLISCAANRQMKLFEVAALALGSVVFCIIVFVKALGLTIGLWPTIP